MTLKEYAKQIYHKIKTADSQNDIETIIMQAIRKLRSNNISEDKIEQFKEEINNCFFIYREAQENSKTIANQKKAKEILSKVKK